MTSECICWPTWLTWCERHSRTTSKSCQNPFGGKGRTTIRDCCAAPSCKIPQAVIVTQSSWLWEGPRIISATLLIFDGKRNMQIHPCAPDRKATSSMPFSKWFEPCLSQNHDAFASSIMMLLMPSILPTILTTLSPEKSPSGPLGATSLNGLS